LGYYLATEHSPATQGFVKILTHSRKIILSYFQVIQLYQLEWGSIQYLKVTLKFLNFSIY